MLSSLKSWFAALSFGAKFAVIAGSLVTATVIGGAIVPSKPIQPQSPVVQRPAQVNHVIKKKDITKIETIGCSTKNIKDNSLAKGKTRINQECKNGSKKAKYQITYTDGVETNRKKLSQTLITKPITKIVALGTYVKPKQISSCDPNYSGACVPIANDVDCGGGSGNGPAYVYTTVRVVGDDIYGLDGDGDGYGCE